MKTAVDTSVLLDVLARETRFGSESASALIAASEIGELLACPVVWGEVRAAFEELGTAQRAMAALGMRYDPFDRACADRAGELWRSYRARGGNRSRLLPDFLIGAHAEVRGGRLLTRDRGFFREYFAGLQLVEPS